LYIIAYYTFLDKGRENFLEGVRRKKYTIIANTTASRDIAKLLKKGCIQQVAKTTSRNTHYEMVIE